MSISQWVRKHRLVLAILLGLQASSPAFAWKLFHPFGCDGWLKVTSPEIEAFREALMRSSYTIRYKDFYDYSSYAPTITGALRNELNYEKPFSEVFPEIRAQLISWALSDLIKADVAYPDQNIEKFCEWLLEELEVDRGYSKTDLERIQRGFRKFSSPTRIGLDKFKKLLGSSLKHLDSVESRLSLLLAQRTGSDELKHSWEKRLKDLLRNKTKVPRQPGEIKALAEEFIKILTRMENMDSKTSVDLLASWSQSLREVNALFAQEIIEVFGDFRSFLARKGVTNSEAKPFFEALEEVALTWTANSTAQSAAKKLISKGIEAKTLAEQE
jgi:hypothetical protein